MPPSNVAIRLPRTYDAEELKRDLAAVESYQKISQPGPYHNGEWKGLSLYAPSGDQEFAGARRSLEELFGPTEILDRTPYIRSLLDGFAAPKQSVRLLALPPGGIIGEHRDDPIGLRNGVVRLHVPIITHPDVELMLAGERVFWGEGELWYGDFSKVHSVINRSPLTRIHLVMDLEVTEALLELFPPEFVAEHRAQGIAVHGRARELTPEERERYACQFLFPAGIIPYFEQGFEGAVQTVGDKLMITVAGSPTFVLVPVDDDRFEVVGFGAGIFFRYAFTGDRPTALDLLIEGGEQVVPMTLLPAPAVAG
jgi:hypothetical protein